MFNKVVLCGRISNDLELRQTNNGKSYCRFNLAVNKNYKNEYGEYETDFITITVWNKQAENIVQYQSKGSLILVEGSISTGNYTDLEGNNRKAFEVMAQNIQFLGNKRNIDVSEEQSDVDSNENDPYEEFGEQGLNDDNFLE